MKRIVFFVIALTVIGAAQVYPQTGTYEKALYAYHKRDFRSAVKHLKAYVAAKPDAGAYYLLGYASYKLKNRTEAAEYFRQAYLIDPDFTPKSLDFKGSGNDGH